MASYIGYKFANYRLTAYLGAGSFGDVYQGEHIDDRTLVAIKVLKTRLTDPQALREFINEARSFRLRHPHIVQLLDFGIANTDIPFLVMDYAPGGSLNQRHPHGEQLSLDSIVSYVKQIASALQYAHDQHVIHRDVKPENMLFGKDNAILMSDFGIAVMVHGTRSGTRQNIAGTAFYMAPEQFRGRAEPASDQYALGILVYEWICGMRPFTADASSPEERLLQLGYQHNHVPPPLLSRKIASLSPAIEQVILKALAKEPKQRFKRIEEFAHALADAWYVSSEKAKQPPETVSPAAKAASFRDTSIVIPDSSQEQRRRRDMIATLDKIAQGLLQQGNTEKALEACEQMLMLDPTSLMALNRKGTLLFQLGKHQEGLALLDEALKLDPTDKHTLSNKARKGTLLFQLGKHQEGLALLDEVLRLDPTNPYALREKANLLLQLSRYDEGIATFGDFIQSAYQPTGLRDSFWVEERLEVLIQQADTLMQMNLPEEAIKFYNEVVLLNQEYKIGLDVGVSSKYEEEKYRYPYEARAEALYRLEKYEETVKACDEIQHSYVSAKSREDEEKKARQHYARRLTPLGETRHLVEPTIFDRVHMLKAQALTKLGRFEEALSSYKQVCEWNASIRRDIGWVLEKLGKYSEAIEEYEKAYKELPQDKDLLIRKGICLLILGKGDHSKYKEALQVFDVIIDIDPTNWNAWRSKGVAFEGLREYEKSLDSYNRAIQLLPTNRGLFKRKAEVLTYLSRFEEALDIYKQMQEPL